MRKKQIALVLTPRIGRIELDYAGGTERVFLNDIKILQNFFRTKVYSRITSNNLHNNSVPISNSAASVTEKLSSSSFYLFRELGKVLRFCLDLWFAIYVLWAVRYCDVVISYSFPVLGALKPSKTLVIMSALWQVDFSQLLRSNYQNTRFLFCSRHLAQSFHHLYPKFGKLNSYILPFSVDPKLFRPISNRKPKFGKKLLLLFASAWVPEKGLDLLLDAILQLPISLRKRIQLSISSDEKLWVSDNPNIYKAYQAELRQKINQLPNVRLLKGMPYKEMPYIYNAHDFLVIPSVWEEPFGLVALEAIACGLPVIAFKSGGLPEILSRKNSILIEEKSAIALCKVFYDILENGIKLKPKSLSLFTAKNKQMTNAVRLRRLTKLINETTGNYGYMG